MLFFVDLLFRNEIFGQFMVDSLVAKYVKHHSRFQKRLKFFSSDRYRN